MTTFKKSDAEVARSFGPGILRIKTTEFEFNPNGIPQELKDRQQWVIWALVEKDNDSTAKTPIYINGSYVGLAKWSLDRALSFDEAYELYVENRDVVSGLGFMFSEEDPYVFIDLDKVVSDDDIRLGYLSNLTWVEKSQSGNGYHMVVKAHLDKACRRNGVELYGWGRFCAMTGLVVGDCLEIAEDQEVVNRLIRDFILKDVGSGEGGLGRYSDKGLFVLPDVIDEGNRDNTLFSYCGSLVWKGHDEESCIKFMREANEDRCRPPLHDDIVVSMVRRQIETRLHKGAAIKKELLESIVHIAEEDKYYDMRSHSLMSRSAMNTRHKVDFPGGKSGEMLLCSWLETHNDALKANNLGWMPAPYGSSEHNLFTHESKILVNTWAGWRVKPVKGDVSVWLAHCSHIIREEEYRTAFIQWCAFMIRFPHIKCNWQIALVGIEGAGKDALFTPISRMLGSAAKGIGNEDIVSGYDDGFVRTKLVIVSEASGLRGNAIERLKRVCATENINMSMMNVKSSAKVFMPNLWAVAVITNHIDALKLSATERRFLVLSAPKVMDTQACNTYFDWLDNGGTEALMHYLLYEVDMTGFNKDRLPCRTTHFDDMFDHTRSDMESMLDDMFYRKDGLFAFDIVFPEYIMEMLRRKEIKCDTRAVTIWLTGMGYKKYPEHKKINKKSGDKIMLKSRKWLALPSGAYDYDKQQGLRMADVYDECEKIERFVASSHKF